MSAYFADAGWDCTLLDISPAAISSHALPLVPTASRQSSKWATVWICLSRQPYDLVFSIGLLEHFEEIEKAIAEQVRILAPNGLFIGYVVPHIPDNVQKNYTWICDILKAIIPLNPAEAKTPLLDQMNCPRRTSLQWAPQV